MANVDPFMGVNWTALKRIALPSERSANYLQAGDVIFIARGARNFAVALEHVEGPAVCSSQFFVIRVMDSDVLLPVFLAWQINQRPTQGYFKREALGSDVLNIRREVIDALSITLPPLRQQHAIAKLAAAATQERIALTKLIDSRNKQMEAIAFGLHREGKHSS